MLVFTLAIHWDGGWCSLLRCRDENGTMSLHCCRRTFRKFTDMHRSFERWTCKKPINYYLILNWVKNEMHALPLSAGLVGCWQHSPARRRTYARGIFRVWAMSRRVSCIWDANSIDFYVLLRNGTWREKTIVVGNSAMRYIYGYSKSHPPRTLNSTRSNLCRARMRTQKIKMNIVFAVIACMLHVSTFVVQLQLADWVGLAGRFAAFTIIKI